MVTFLYSTDAWYLAGISVMVVFGILVALVVVLNIFSMVAKASGKAHKAHKAQEPVLAPGQHADALKDDHFAVVATAIYLYLNSGQDEESGVITIESTPSAGWHAVLNPRL